MWCWRIRRDVVRDGQHRIRIPGRRSWCTCKGVEESNQRLLAALAIPEGPRVQGGIPKADKTVFETGRNRTSSGGGKAGCTGRIKRIPLLAIDTNNLRIRRVRRPREE